MKERYDGCTQTVKEIITKQDKVYEAARDNIRRCQGFVDEIKKENAELNVS